MNSEHQQWQEVKENYLKLIEKNLAQVDHPQRSEILSNVREHLDSKYAELLPEQKNWEGFQQIITEMGPPEDYAELLNVETSGKQRQFGINALLAVLFVVVLAAVGSYLIYTAKETPAPKAYIITFEPVSPFDPQTARELLTAFNKDHPSGVRTHHYRTTIEDKELVGLICVDSKPDAEAVKKMLERSDTLKFLNTKAVTQKEFEEYCQQKQVSLSSNSASVYDQISQSPVIFVNDLPIDGIVINKPDCTADFIQSRLGPPVRTDADGKMLRYTNHGIDLWFSGNKHLSEVHLNRSFKGKLDTGISMSSTMQDVFDAYGQPTHKIQAPNLHSKNDDRILYQKGDISRIFYGQDGLIFWFQGDKISQIVPFRGQMKSSNSIEISPVPIAHWKFDEGNGNIVHDSAGKNHGMIYGAKWVPGKTGTALSFPGNGYVEVPDSDALDLTDQMTIAAWVRAAKSQPTNHARIVCKLIHPVSGYTLNIRENRIVRFGFHDNDSVGHGIGSASSVCDETWHHVVGTFDGKNLRIYVDGVLENSENAEGYTIKPNDRPLRIGQTPNPTENQIFKGVIDDVRIYNQALSFKDIEKLYEDNVKSPVSAPKTVDFESDERVLGKWVTVDFVRHIDDFKPHQKSWQGELFLKELTFENNGILWWTNNNGGPYKHCWIKGKVDPLDKRPAFYYLRNLDGQTYLFFEWISGDVIDRGREPSYYVLKQPTNDESPVLSWFENDPRALGDWKSIDFVKTIEDFDPEHLQTSELFLKTLHFEENGKLLWTVGESKPIALDWTKGKIRPFGIWPASYVIKPFGKTDYLFYEYRTRDSNPAGYYVFKRAQTKEITQEIPQYPFVNDPQVLGQWKTVDFIRTLDAFQPNQQSWRGPLFVKELDFKQGGGVEWCLGEDQMKIKHRWTKGKLLDDELPSRYFIETYKDGDYLFMEWNSGDVTIRGQKPCYYVLKKAK